jgi:retron-type reverse transcriptase
MFEEGFSISSYGYRPGRNAQQAVEQTRKYAAQGRRWVVDIDLEKFFDSVNHDILMDRVERKVKDDRITRRLKKKALRLNSFSLPEKRFRVVAPVINVSPPKTSAARQLVT